MGQKRLYCDYVKRLLDIVLSSFALIVLSPLLLITALMVRLKLGSPVVFKQARPGKNEKFFYLLKFRSMTNEVGSDGRLLPDSQRLNSFGKFLRASSLDELLELVNIIKGDMSIVGPRPLSIYYLPHYPADFRRRHDMRPGLTGLAQVNGRNNLPWDERFEMDIKYVESASFLLDAKIILSTALKVLKHSDVSVRGTAKVKDYGPYSILKEEGNGGQKLADMSYSEIGSYFWLADVRENKRNSYVDCDWLPSVEDSCFTFSGRNSIDVALRDIMKYYTINKVLVPSYSCVSMLQSFIDRGLKIEFYEVGYREGAFNYKIPNVDNHTVVLIMSYFGLDSSVCHEEIRKLHKEGAVVIEDITHSMLSSASASEDSDYIVTSMRKWFAIPAGGWIGKKSGRIIEKPDICSNHAVEEKILAMQEKYRYLTGEIDSKEHFLFTHAKFDNDLIHVDRMLKIDDTSLNIIQEIKIDDVIDQRRRNVKKLLVGLKDLDGEILTLPSVDLKNDTPLFLPVFLITRYRDDLRKYLVEHGIYCPVHWPEVMGAELGIRAFELSLICDQRYTEGDMEAIVDAIHEWYKRSC